MSVSTARKAEIVAKFQQHAGDTGSPEVQVALLSELSHALEQHLSAFEIEQTAARCTRLLQRGCFPLPHGDWPSIPWPPF